MRAARRADSAHRGAPVTAIPAFIRRRDVSVRIAANNGPRSSSPKSTKTRPEPNDSQRFFAGARFLRVMLTETPRFVAF
jgi:hypothetical protein